MKHSCLFLPATLIIFFSSCRKEPDLSALSAKPTVVTNRDKNANFGSYSTYFVSDTIAYISGSTTDTIYTGPDALQLIDAIKQNMSARGYQLVAKDANPDLGINTAILKINIQQNTIYPGWWAGYPGYWDPWYWGSFYPYYYPYGTTYTYIVGTFVMNMVDLKNANATERLDVPWTAYLAGYLGTSSTENISYAVEGINQAFKQSDYLRK